MNRRPMEPAMDDRDLAELDEGIGLFNEGKFWHAHEAWEQVWRRKVGVCDGFFKGLIQAAAAFHKMRQNSVRGMCIHFDRSAKKLKPCAPVFLGVELEALIRHLERCRAEVESNGFPSGEPPKLIRRE